MRNKIAQTTQVSASEYYLHDLSSSYNLVLKISALISDAIDRVKISDARPNIIHAFAGTNIAATITVENGDVLVLAVQKPGCFIVDYNVPEQDLRFQFMNSIRVVGKPLNLNYIHMREDNRTSEPEPEVWIDLDISHSMLDVALENEVEDGLLLRDMGQGLGLRSGFIDGAISISAAACSDPDYPPHTAVLEEDDDESDVDMLSISNGDDDSTAKDQQRGFLKRQGYFCCYLQTWFSRR
ncbi:hypothetical protein TB2_046995 [Malus domestica]